MAVDLKPSQVVVSSSKTGSSENSTSSTAVEQAIVALVIVRVVVVFTLATVVTEPSFANTDSVSSTLAITVKAAKLDMDWSIELASIVLLKHFTDSVHAIDTRPESLPFEKVSVVVAATSVDFETDQSTVVAVIAYSVTAASKIAIATSVVAGPLRYTETESSVEVRQHMDSTELSKATIQSESSELAIEPSSINTGTKSLFTPANQ